MNVDLEPGAALIPGAEQASNPLAPAHGRERHVGVYDVRRQELDRTVEVALLEKVEESPDHLCRRLPNLFGVFCRCLVRHRLSIWGDRAACPHVVIGVDDRLALGRSCARGTDDREEPR